MQYIQNNDCFAYSTVDEVRNVLPICGGSEFCQKLILMGRKSF